MNIRIYLLFILGTVLSTTGNPSVNRLDDGVMKRISSLANSASIIKTNVDHLAESDAFQSKMARVASTGFKISNILFNLMTIVFAYYGGLQCMEPCVNESFLSKMAIWSSNSVLAGGVLGWGLFYALATLKMQMPWEYVPIFMMNIVKMGIVSEFRWAFLAKHAMRQTLSRTAMQLSQFDLVLLLGITAMQQFNLLPY